ncbi:MULTISPECIES: hypothetical protein [unclassified Frigoribacterium]|uniref:hypothetical protein n=1 Tax=unclassified Frigoribacterium TaxID=2627005 RepID=UPI0006FE49CF|nr:MULTISPECIES: hypothetical protein [unclassified Frigoribacterium]KQM24112.1 hypothetical protein ASL10_12295 [Frigoribacterium sp. Leaf8]ROS50152.1 hypothetical protein EDF21_2942 [Frigoribacterium sp. PhB118]
MPLTQPGPPTVRSRLRAASVSASGPEGRERLLVAATALVVVLVARFALGLVALVGSAVGFSVTAFPSGFVATPVGQFLGSFVLYPFPFYVASFVVLATIRPLTPRSDLRTVVRHAVVAGGAGTLALAVVGIVPGIVLSIDGGTWVNLALYLTTIPLSAGIVDTALLVAGAVLARLWLGGGHGDEVWAVEPTPRVAEAGEGDDAGDVEDDVAPPAVRGDRSTRLPTTVAAAPSAPVVPPERPVVPSHPAPAPDDWSRFAPPAGPNEDDR